MKKLSISRFVISLSVVVIVSLSLLFLTVIRGLSIPYVSDFIHSSITVISKPFSIPVQWVTSGAQGVKDLSNAYQENIDLKSALNENKVDESEIQSLREENESLKSALDIKNKLSTVSPFSASVLDRTSNSWLDQLNIDFGSNNGARSNMLVLANGGIIGYLSETYANSSVVRLFSASDDQNTMKLSVKISLKDGKSAYGILSGFDQDTSSFIISQLNASEIAEGDEVVTSDLDSSVVPNLQVGTVTKVETNANDLSSTVFVRPVANLASIYAVVVVGK